MLDMSMIELLITELVILELETTEVSSIVTLVKVELSISGGGGITP